MKKLLLFILFMLPLALLQAQTLADSAFHYDRPFYTCENQWVMTPGLKGGTSHMFGYIYLDPTAGFTFELEGELKSGENQQLVKVDNGPRKVLTKIRLGNKTVKFCPLTKEQVMGLGLEEHPSRLDVYLIKNQEIHDVAVGTTLNVNGFSAEALPYLQRVYAVNPDTRGVEFELAFAYNALGKTDDAIAVLERAVKVRPTDGNLYKELGYAQMIQGNWQEALVTFQKGWGFDASTDSGYRGEMAYHIAVIYRDKLKDQEKYRFWGLKAKQMVSKNSLVYQKLADIELPSDQSPGKTLYDKLTYITTADPSLKQLTDIEKGAATPEKTKKRTKSTRNKTGTFTDERDGQTYKWVKIGGMTWMAENLNFSLPGSSHYYGNEGENRKKYGMLYDFNSLGKACPKGWHIPSDQEWQLLEMAVGMSREDTAADSYRGSVADELLEGGSSGFNVLFGGYYSQYKFQKLGSQAYFWTSTSKGMPIITRIFNIKDSRICRSLMGIGHFLSVRCVKDE